MTDDLRTILIERGYTISAAARACGVSANHLSLVARGQRTSKVLLEKIAKLPKKPLVLREKRGLTKNF